MVLTDDAKIAATLRELREYDGLAADRLRFNGKMSDIAAAIGRVQLKRLSSLIDRRRMLAAGYREGLQQTGLSLPRPTPGHIYFRYVVYREKGAEILLDRLAEMGVAARRPIPRPLHREMQLPDAMFPQTTKAYMGDVSLPLYPDLTETEVDRVITAVCSAMEKEAGV